MSTCQPKVLNNIKNNVYTQRYNKNVNNQQINYENISHKKSSIVNVNLC